jgi:hypothetical protein
MEWRKLDSFGSGYGHVSGSSEHGDEPASYTSIAEEPLASQE